MQLALPDFVCPSCANGDGQTANGLAESIENLFHLYFKKQETVYYFHLKHVSRLRIKQSPRAAALWPQLTETLDCNFHVGERVFCTDKFTTLCNSTIAGQLIKFLFLLIFVFRSFCFFLFFFSKFTPHNDCSRLFFLFEQC